jgi:hypothetical protein
MATTTLDSTSVTRTTSTVLDVTRLTGVYGLPFARSIPLLIELTGMKPYTALHSFIDNANIDASVYPTQEVSLTTESGKFLGSTEFSAPNAWTIIRDWDTADFQGNLQSLYPNGYWAHCNMITVGEIVRHYVTPTQFYAGVVIARQTSVDPTTRLTKTVLHLALVRLYNTATAYTDNVTSWSWATFPSSATVRGDSSGATGTSGAVVAPNVGSIATNGLGNWYGLYLIPAGTVRTGDHTITFTDDVANSGNGFTTATAGFQSHGELDVYTHTVIKRVDTFVTNTYTVREYTDPLAETFTIPSDKTSGCYVTSVDLYFAIVNPAETQPVTVQICDTLNGYPGANVLFNATSQLSPSNITASTNASVATRFRFAGPVFLEPGKEYCIKVLTNSTAYKVWIAQIGEAKISDPTKFVTAQPYLGVLFKSQNNSTWTADQTQDLMFNLYQAKFNTSASGLVTVQNLSNATALSILPSNPITVANGQAVAKVYSPNHGLFAGGFVDISGSTYTAANGRFAVVQVVNSDYFTITLGSAAAFSGLTGGTAVRATKSIKYESIKIDIGNDYAMRTGTSMVATLLQSTASAKDTTSVTANTGTGIQSVPKYIHSDVNEALVMGGKKSIDVNFNIFSNNSDLSPIINRNTLAAVLVSNKINTPASANNTVVDNNTIITALAGVTFTAATGIIGVPTTVDMNHFKIGAYITISGTTSNNASHKITAIDTNVSPYAVYVTAHLSTNRQHQQQSYRLKAISTKFRQKAALLSLNISHRS